MNVIEFRPKVRTGAWDDAEISQIVAAVHAEGAGRRVGNWDVGATDAGDPQFYLLTPPPENDCVLCISRLGSTYVLEDGRGMILREHNSLAVLASDLKNYLRKRRRGLVARLLLLWCGLRQNVEQKVDAVWAESEDLLVHVVPQAAAFV
jgi:hypothetical protein